MTVVAGVDTSTQSCTVAIFDADTGRLLGQSSAPHVRAVPPVSEQDPAQWWEAFRACLAAAADAARVPVAQLAAISVAGQCHGLVALDRTGEVIRPAKLWNDTTSAPQADRLVALLGAAEWAKRAGSVPTAAFTISKIAWLAEHEPENFAKVGYLLMPHDWINWRLTGQMITDRSEASGTGYFDVNRNQWAPDLLDLVDDSRHWSPMLPTVCEPFNIAGRVTAEAAGDTGLTPGTVVGAGAGDQHAAALALGVTQGDLLISLGTSGVVLTQSATPCADGTGMVNSVCDAAGGYLPLVCTLNASQVTDAVAEWLGVDHNELARLAIAEPAGKADRPVLAAFFGGERSPNLPAARGLLGGLDLNTTRGGLARAAFEGVLLGLLAGVKALVAAGCAVNGRLLVTGGGSKSAAYVQLLADLTGRDVTVLNVPDATVRGAALQAATAVTGEKFTDLAAHWVPPTAPCVTPRSGATASAVNDRYQELATWPGHRLTWESAQ